MQSTDPDIYKNWRRKEGDELKFDYVIDGDHIWTLFVCDCCVFHKIYGMEPDLENPVLQASTNPGRHDKSHSQWQTVRHVKGAIANFERTFNEGLALVDDDKAISQHFQEGGSSSLWYSRFAQGCRA